MNNTRGSGRKRAGLADLHVHDLRHTVGMRLREAGVAESVVADILWHSSPTMTHHYTDDNGHVTQTCKGGRAEPHGAEVQRVTTVRVGGVHHERHQDAAHADIGGQILELDFREFDARIGGVFDDLRHGNHARAAGRRDRSSSPGTDWLGRRTHGIVAQQI